MKECLAYRNCRSHGKAEAQTHILVGYTSRGGRACYAQVVQETERTHDQLLARRVVAYAGHLHRTGAGMMDCVTLLALRSEGMRHWNGLAAVVPDLGSLS